MRILTDRLAESLIVWPTDRLLVVGLVDVCRLLFCLISFGVVLFSYVITVAIDSDSHLTHTWLDLPGVGEVWGEGGMWHSHIYQWALRRVYIVPHTKHIERDDDQFLDVAAQP